MTIVVSTSSPIWNFCNNAGQPLVGGQLFSYLAGTVTPVATYVDSTGTQANTNPILLNAHGDTSNASGASCGVWIPPNTGYKFVLQDNQSPPNTIWTLDNYFAPISTAAAIGAALYPQTAVELAQSITPVNTIYPAGNILRYGADPTGLNPSQTALSNAIVQAYSGGSPVYVPAGTYTVTAETVSNSATGYEMYGDGNQVSILQVTGPGLGVNGSILHFNHVTTGGVHIHDLKFFMGYTGNTNVALRFLELRSASTIHDCLFLGVGGPSVDTYGILFDGGGVAFTGGVTVHHNQFAQLLFGIVASPTAPTFLTTCRIVQNDIYGPSGLSTSKGVYLASGARQAGVVVEDNDIENWGVGVYTNGTQTRIAFNTFAANSTNDIQIVRGAGVSQTLTTVIGNVNSAGMSIAYTPFSGDGNIILEQGINYIENLVSTQSGGYYVEQARSFGLGMPQTPTFSAGNFAANGAMTWTVAGGGVTTYIWSLYGKTMTVWFDVSGTIGGTINTQVTIAIPGGFLAAAAVSNPCDVLDNAIWATGLAAVSGSATVISIQKGATVPSVTNYTAGTAAVYGQITFPVQ